MSSVRPVIFTDKQYAIMDDLSAYKAVNASEAAGAGLDLEHMKAAVRALAKLHAMGLAYFGQGSEDVTSFSEVLKLLIDKPYQPSASQQDKQEAKDELEAGFNNLLAVVRLVHLCHSNNRSTERRSEQERLNNGIFFANQVLRRRRRRHRRRRQEALRRPPHEHLH